MSINGNYTQVGKDMVQALQSAARSGPGIEANELASLRSAALADQDLSAGEAQLLQDLEQATAAGDSVQNFELADFNPADLEFGQLNLRVSNNQASVAPAAERLAQRGSETLRRSVEIMDLGRQLPGADTDAPPAHFDQNARQLARQSQTLDALITRAEQLDPPATETITQLQQMRTLNESLKTIQSHWSASTNGDIGVQDATTSLRQIQAAQALLADIDPAVLGPQTHARLQAQLQSQAETVGRYANEHDGNFIFENEDLGEFMLRATPADTSPAPVTDAPVGPALDDSHSLANFNDLITLPGQLQSEQTAAQGRLQGHLAPYLDAAPPVLRQYLSNPSQLPESERANVREAFNALFQAHPDLAGQISQELSAPQSSIPALRTRLEDQLQRARAHGQTEQITQLENQLQGLAESESQVVRTWQDQQGLLLEGLAVAARESEAVARATTGARSWIDSAQNRYASTQLAVPENRTLLSNGFEASLASEAGAEMRAKIERTTQDYGPPVSTVPMALVTEGTGATLNFNAYVYRDGDSYFALNPLDQKFYPGATPEAALAALGRDSRMVAGQLHFHDGQQMQQFPVQPPEDSSTWNMVMSGVGLVGAGVLILIPEPTTTAAGLAIGASILAVGASSGYFVAQGATQMHELIQSDNFGNNRDTWMAALDVASGLLGVAGAAGSGARLVTQSTRLGVQSALMQSLARMGSSRALSAAELADAGIGVGLVAEQIISIQNSSHLSDTQKQAEVAKIVMLSATSLMMSQVLNRNHTQGVQSQQQLQLTHMEQMRSFDTMSTQIAGITTPQGALAVRDTLTQALNAAEADARSARMEGNPQLRNETLERIATLRSQLEQLPAFRTPSQSASYEPGEYGPEHSIGVNGGNGWAHSVTPGIPSPNQLAALKGTAPETGAAGFDGVPLQGMRLDEIISRIPQQADLREMRPNASIQEGFEYTWQDSQSQATWRVRLHGPDGSADPGSNANAGWTVRIERDITDPATGVVTHEQMDGSGTFHSRDASSMDQRQRDLLLQRRTEYQTQQQKVAEIQAELDAARQRQAEANAAAGTTAPPYTEEQQAAYREIRRLEQKLERALPSLEQKAQALALLEAQEARTNGVHIPIAGNPILGGQP
ncbi:MAG: polymorphic toxin type 30 domain-containing protein [Candidatus Sericytochromatia bacterium]